MRLLPALVLAAAPAAFSAVAAGILPDSGLMNFVDQPEMWHKAANDFLSGK